MTPSRPAAQQRILTLTRGWLGTPYLHQASLKGVGCDCLGLVRGVYAEACGGAVEPPPPYSRDWAEATRRETLIEGAERYMIRVPVGEAQPGDMLIFRFRPGAMAKHCAILSEDALAANERPSDTRPTRPFHSPGALTPPSAPPYPLGQDNRISQFVVPALSRDPIQPSANPRFAGEIGPGSRPGQRPREAAESHIRPHAIATPPGEGAKIIHAVEGAPVCEVSLTPWWRRRIAAAFRFPIEEQ